VFDGCAAVVEATVVNSYTAGDHSIYIGRVDYAESDENGRPLIYYQGAYHILGEEAVSQNSCEVKAV
jgi:flavin reductase (DIM6/NTAB) family NADH-FMN oxidoreductase RutF